MNRIIVGIFGVLLAGFTVRAADPLAEAPAHAPSVARLANADDTRRKLGLLPDYASNPGLKTITIAVLDSGFEGVDGKRPYLPANTVLVEHYDQDFVRRNGLGNPDFLNPFVPGNAHGRQMAQIVWGMTGNSPDGPRFLLLNANGPTMFRRAVRYAVEQKADVILFSGNFEGAGNYDGRGPINAAVDEAVAAGIVWVNAAGNSGGKVYNGPVDVGPGGYVRFGEQTSLRFTNRFDENAVTITLTWNDYRDTEDFGTDKDLDLIVEDAQGRVVGASKLVQVPPGQDAGEGKTRNPRERITLTDLPAVATGQEYRIRVLAKGNNFTARDRLRILLVAEKDTLFPDPDTGKMTEAVAFLDASRSGEIYPPADHPGVITVGDGSRVSAVGPTADGRVKPDVVLSSSVARFSNGDESVGSSNAAAYFAGVVVVLQSHEPGFGTRHIREWVRRIDVWNRAPARGSIPPAPPPAVLPSAFPPGLPIPTNPSPNQQRAMKYVENTLEDKKKRGEDPNVWLSTPGGTYQIRPGVPTSGPATAPPVIASRAEPPHAAWITPPLRSLNELVHDR